MLLTLQIQTARAVSQNNLYGRIHMNIPIEETLYGVVVTCSMTNWLVFAGTTRYTEATPTGCLWKSKLRFK